MDLFLFMSGKLFSQNRIKVVIILAACVLLVFFNPKGFFNPIRGGILEIIYPFQKTFYLLSQKVRIATGFLSSISDLKKENEKLTSENNALSSEIIFLKDTKNENDNLREQLNLIPREKFKLEASFVIGSDPQRSGSWIMIDKGNPAGIEEGMPVIVSEGILVGKVAEVYGNTAKVDLLTNSSSIINAVDIETEAKGVVRGEYGLGALLDMVAQTDVLNGGDTIATSGLGGDVPAGLLIGKIQEIRVTQDRLFQQAIIMPRVKYADLDVVFVIKN